MCLFWNFKAQILGGIGSRSVEKCAFFGPSRHRFYRGFAPDRGRNACLFQALKAQILEGIGSRSVEKRAFFGPSRPRFYRGFAPERGRNACLFQALTARILGGDLLHKRSDKAARMNIAAFGCF